MAEIKEPGAFRTGLTVAGCLLGAGFVSGQEIWKFFGVYGAWGLIGVAIAMLALTYLIYVMFYIAMDMNEVSILKTFVPFEWNWLRTVFFSLQFAFLISVEMAMIAGCGAQLSLITNVPNWLGSVIACALGIIITMRGLQGIIEIFSLTTPILGICTVIFGILAITHASGASTFPPQSADTTLPLAMLGSCLSYISYNVLGPSSVLIQLGGNLKKRKTARLAPLVGTLILMPIAYGVLVSMALHPEVICSEIPMSDYAYSLNPMLGTIYGVLLFISMFGCVISCAVGASSALFERFLWMEKYRKMIVPAICLICLAGSRVGFGNLISLLYPLFGKFNLVFLLTLLLNYFGQRGTSTMQQ